MIENFTQIQLWFTFIIPILGLMTLILTKAQFTARSEFERIEDGIIISIFVLFGSLIYGTIGFLALGEKYFLKSFSFVEAIYNTLLAFIFFDFPEIKGNNEVATWFLASLHILGITTFLLIIISLFRPLLYTLKIFPEEKKIAEEILEKYSNSAIDYFKIWPEKTFFFSSDKESFLSYKVKYGVAICLGDPSGPPEKLEKFLKEFIGFCDRNGWKIGFHHTKPDLRKIYKKFNFSMIKIGEEGTVDLDKFVSTTINHHDFKRNIRKFSQIGYSLEIVDPPHDKNLLIQLKQISDEWLSMGRRERGFTLGHFSYSYLQKTPIILLKDSENKIIAFLNQINSFNTNEVTIDMMRHGENMPNGAMDFIFSSYLTNLQKKGFKTFSLGLSPFIGLNEFNDSPIIEKVLKELSEHFTGLFSFKGLRYFKEKFEPSWENRYLVYKGNYYSFLKTAYAFIRVSEK